MSRVNDKNRRAMLNEQLGVSEATYQTIKPIQNTETTEKVIENINQMIYLNSEIHKLINEMKINKDDLIIGKNYLNEKWYEFDDERVT